MGSQGLFVLGLERGGGGLYGLKLFGERSKEREKFGGRKCRIEGIAIKNISLCNSIAGRH